MKGHSMTVFPQSSVCPLAVERNRLRCSDLTGKPNNACNACRAELTDELGSVMLNGDASFFEMLFVDHILQREGFVGAPDEEGGILLKRARGKRIERPGDCAIRAVSPILGGGFSFFVCIDDDHAINDTLESLEDAIRCYFDHQKEITNLESESDCGSSGTK